MMPVSRVLPAFRQAASALALAAGILISGAPAAAESKCSPVFPVTAAVGDFELTLDPADPLGNLLLAVNIGEGGTDAGEQGSIQLARLSGDDGLPIAKPTAIATNFTGTNWLNGPEFIHHPETKLGIVYNGPEGVHGAWRLEGRWDAFDYDVAGAPFAGNPPALPSTAPGRHPVTSPSATRMFLQFSSESSDPCSRKCYGLASDEVATVFNDALAALGLRGGGAGTSVPHPHQAAEDHLLFTACEGRQSDACAVYEVAIDGAGGLVGDSLLRLSEYSTELGGSSLEAGVHPVTGALVVFTMGADALAVWQSDGLQQPLERVAHFTSLPDDPDHLRLVETAHALVLHFIDRRGVDEGSYLSFYDTLPRSPVWVSQQASGAELVYLPAADHLALYYKSIRGGIVRCWVP